VITRAHIWLARNELGGAADAGHGSFGDSPVRGGSAMRVMLPLITDSGIQHLLPRRVARRF